MTAKTKAKPQVRPRRRGDPYIGREIHILPLQRTVMNWLKRNAARGVDWTVVTLLDRAAEYLTIRTASGKERELGPREATWSPIYTAHEENDRLIRLVSHEIACYVESRVPRLLDKGPAERLAGEIRERAWQKPRTT